MANFGAAAQSQLLGAALKSGALGGGSPEKTFFYVIPIQVGPPSGYARNVRHWFHVILIIQATVCGARFIFLQDFLGGFWMALLCGLGWYAWQQDMNITYVCLWGLGCLVNGIFDILGIIIPVIFSALTLQIIDICLRALVPASELLGAAFAWHLYLDYFTTGGGANDNSFMHDVAAGMPDPMGKLVDQVDPGEYDSIANAAARGGEQFQKTWESGAIAKQVKQGGKAMQQGVEQVVEKLSHQQEQQQPQLPQLPLLQPSTPATRSHKQAPCC